ncbi:EAL domain-containing protein [Paenibacillus sp. MBLB4367]|uniref:EAL domain-containing protein n=1 Tax=Paenibacillus sp. MBLB4367 TaxID=3384767 RepID=UPI003908058A
MQKIPVTRDGNAHSEVVVIDSDDVIKIEALSENRIILHTQNAEYVMTFSMESLEGWLFEEGFRLLDSSTLVNTNRITRYDSGKGVVYLGEPDEPLVKTASVSQVSREQLLQVLAGRQEDGGPPAPSSDYSIAEVATSVDRFSGRPEGGDERGRARGMPASITPYDALTGLPTRGSFQAMTNARMREPLEAGRMMAVILLNIDRFQTFNASFGHAAGDQLLREVAERLSAALPDHAFLSRCGGDEFLLLLQDMPNLDKAADFVKTIHALLREPFENNGHDLYVTVSTGISLYPNDGIDAESLIKHADVALHRAKQKGGNAFQLYHPEMNSRSLHLLTMEVELRQAAERGQFLLHYQPLINTASGKVIGMESLIRWNHPDWGRLSPEAFIPVAEESGIIGQIGLWVLKEACRQAKEWQDAGLGAHTVTVNISSGQLQQPGFVASVKEILDAADLAPQLLCLELTNSGVLKNTAFLDDSMHRLLLLGVQLSIDNFGTGFCTFGDLKRFRVQTIKLDKTFIHDLSEDGDNAAIVSAMVAVSRRLNMRTVAKGVETVEQLKLLRKLGCEEMQGFLFCAPLPPDQVVPFMNNAGNRLFA